MLIAIDRSLPDNRLAITTHFLLHGLHHYLPMDKYRITTSPFYFFIFASPFYRFIHYLMPGDWYGAIAVFCGWLFGFVYYDIIHYILHHKSYVNPICFARPKCDLGLKVLYRVPKSLMHMKRYHLQHHYYDYENGFGVTTRFWDRVFGTELAAPKAAAKAAAAR